MRKIIVNSTPIISLAGIDKLILLKKLYKEIIVPDAVYEEVIIAVSYTHLTLPTKRIV